MVAPRVSALCFTCVYLMVLTALGRTRKHCLLYKETQLNSCFVGTSALIYSAHAAPRPPTRQKGAAYGVRGTHVMRSCGSSPSAMKPSLLPIVGEFVDTTGGGQNPHDSLQLTVISTYDGVCDGGRSRLQQCEYENAWRANK